MAINYTRLFTTLGKIVGGLNEANTYRGTTFGARADALSARFDAALQHVAEGLYPARDAHRTAHNRWVQFLSELAQDTIIAEVDLDRPIAKQTLATALKELDRQMRVDGQSLSTSPLSVVSTPSLTDGAALLIASSLVDFNLDSQLALPDVYNVSVPRGFLGGDTAYQEFLAIQGKAEAVPSTSWLWPGGSGINVSIQMRDPALNNQGLVNGQLSSLTNWTGTGGSWTVGAATVAPRSGYTANVAKFAPSGASGSIVQTITNPRARSVYAWTAKYYKHTSGPQTWNVFVRIYDNSGTILSFTQASSSLSTGWNTVGGFFATPEFINGSLRFEIGYSNITASSNLEICHAGFVQATPLYPHGPTVVGWSGTKPLTTRDKWTVTATVGGTGALHRGIDRLVNLRANLPYGLPVSSSPTQSDALVS
jgi:hypothetical protein